MVSALESQTVALIGICVIFGVSLLVTIVFLAVYARQRLKNYSNVRRRIVAIARPVTEVPLISQDIREQSPLPVIDYPEPAPVPAPALQKVVVLQPPPQPQPQPQPQPPPPPREPEVVVHKVIHRYEPTLEPPPPPTPQKRILRRRLSWGCPHELDDDWVLVKRVVKNPRNKAKAKKSKYESSSEEEESSDDEYHIKAKRHQKKRLDRYDLATNFIPIGIQQPAQSQLMSSAGFVMAQPAASSAAAPPAMVPVTMLAQQTCTPIFTVTR